MDAKASMTSQAAPDQETGERVLAYIDALDDESWVTQIMAARGARAKKRRALLTSSDTVLDPLLREARL